jgi:hypothetical protein
MSLAEKEEKSDNLVLWAVGCITLAVIGYFITGGTISQFHSEEFPTVRNNYDSPNIANMHGLTSSTSDKPIAWYEGLGTGPAGTIPKELNLKLANGEPCTINNFGVRKHFIDLKTVIGKNRVFKSIFDHFPLGIKKVIIDDNFINNPPGAPESYKKSILATLQEIIQKLNKKNVIVELAIQPFNDRSAVEIGATTFEGNYSYSYQLPAKNFAKFKALLGKLILILPEGSPKGSVIIYQEVSGQTIPMGEISKMKALAREESFEVQLF